MSETSSGLAPVMTLQDMSDESHVKALTAAMELLMRHAHLERSESLNVRNGPTLQALAADSSDRFLEQALKVHHVIMALTGAGPATPDWP